MLNHRTFDLSGMDDAHLAIKGVVDRYPNAPRVAMGFSLGGSQLQDYMARYNEEHRYFAAGIKVDGVNNWVELVQFGIRQNIISKVLGEVVHSSYIKSLFAKTDSKSNEVDPEKVQAMQREEGCEAFDFEEIVSRKSAECLIIDVVRMMMAPAVKGPASQCPVKYLQSKGPADMERINVPFLVMNSWNDSFQDPDDLPIGIANSNPNVIHLVTRLGAHCIRREGLLGRKCWQSACSLEFANAVVNIGKSM